MKEYFISNSYPDMIVLQFIKKTSYFTDTEKYYIFKKFNYTIINYIKNYKNFI